MLYRATILEAQSTNQVLHAHEVLLNLAETQAASAEFNAAQRGYLVSGDDTLLADRARALARLNNGVHRLRELLVAARMRALLPQFEQAVAARVRVAHETEQLRRNRGLEVTAMLTATRDGQAAIAAINAILADMRREENRLMALRLADLERQRERVRNVMLLAALAAILVLLPLYVAFALQARARAQEARQLELIFDLSPDPFCIVGMDGFFRRLSPAMGEILGYSPGEFLARPFMEFVHPENQTATLAAMDRLRHGEPLRDFNNRYRCRDGTWRDFSWNVQPNPGDGLLYCAVRDVTERNQIERELVASSAAAVEANRAKSTFLATMSHEIRTPMNGVLGMLELLSLTALGADQRKTLEIARASGTSLLRIIDDILDFSKIEAGKLDVRPEPSSIQDVIEGVHSIFSGNASSKGLVLKGSMDPRISPALQVDAVRLRQILSNLVSNAIKFTDRGAVEIRAELVERVQGADHVRFTVRDEGIGIAPEDQPHLFQPFSQGSGPGVRRTTGTGLGLSISQRLAGLMGGAIDMASHPGQGTTMTLALTLPIVDPDLLSRADTARSSSPAIIRAARKSPRVAQAEIEGTLILVVDDHPTNRILIMRQVNALGYAAETASNGIEALAAWKTNRFGLVISDCNMPEMDGYELARAIRCLEADNGGTHTPIIACTANALAGETEICLAAGMDDYLVKPVELHRLQTKLHQWLPESEALTVPGARSAATSAGGSSTETPAPIDTAALAGTLGGDIGTVHNIVADFRRANDADMATLTDAVTGGDLPRFIRAAHRMKGAGLMVGATDLAGVATRLEQDGVAGDWDAIRSNLGALQSEWERLNAYIDTLETTLQSPAHPGDEQKGVHA